MVVEAAIEGGMDIESAYLLSDSYIRKCDNARDIQSVAQLFNCIILDFVTKVKECKVPNNVSALTFQCIQYINNHINEPPQVSDIANHFNVSRSYLSSIFKTELGFTIKDFITSKRVEEAKNLLTYTSISISQISTLLCFSDQAHF